MNSKRAVLGGIMAIFVATVVILIILLVFILGSGVIKKATGNVEGIDILTESDVGISDILGYLPSYSKLMRVKVDIGQGRSFEEGGYVE